MAWKISCRQPFRQMVRPLSAGLQRGRAPFLPADAGGYDSGARHLRSGEGGRNQHGDTAGRRGSGVDLPRQQLHQPQATGDLQRCADPFRGHAHAFAHCREKGRTRHPCATIRDAVCDCARCPVVSGFGAWRARWRAVLLLCSGRRRDCGNGRARQTGDARS